MNEPMPRGPTTRPGGECGVAEDLLVVQRQNRYGDVDTHSQQRDQKTASAEVAILKHVQVDQAARIRPRAPDPSDEAEDERRHGPAHPEGSEPVVFLAFIEDNLQAAGPDNEEAEADVIEGANLGVLDVGRVVHEADDHEDGKYADGNVDVEGIAPAESVGEPTAQRGTQYGGDDDSEAVGGHRHGSLLRWKALEQDGLR